MCVVSVYIHPFHLLSETEDIPINNSLIQYGSLLAMATAGSLKGGVADITWELLQSTPNILANCAVDLGEGGVWDERYMR